jgi:hypothetical protein
MKTKCYSVRLESLYQISEKALKAVAFNGSEDIIPASQVFGRDWDVIKSEAYWISAWILEKKTIQYSSKKEAWFYNDSRKMAPDITVTKHIPTPITKKPTHDTALTR